MCVWMVYEKYVCFYFCLMRKVTQREKRKREIRFWAQSFCLLVCFVFLCYFHFCVLSWYFSCLLMMMLCYTLIHFAFYNRYFASHTHKKKFYTLLIRVINERFNLFIFLILTPFLKICLCLLLLVYACLTIQANNSIARLSCYRV